MFFDDYPKLELPTCFYICIIFIDKKFLKLFGLLLKKHKIELIFNQVLLNNNSFT